MSALHVNLDLIRKYNVPGPRYTSYPPAVHFTEQVSLPALQEKIRGNNRAAGCEVQRAPFRGCVVDDLLKLDE